MLCHLDEACVCRVWGVARSLMAFHCSTFICADNMLRILQSFNKIIIFTVSTVTVRFEPVPPRYVLTTALVFWRMHNDAKRKKSINLFSWPANNPPSLRSLARILQKQRLFPTPGHTCARLNRLCKSFLLSNKSEWSLAWNHTRNLTAIHLEVTI